MIGIVHAAVDISSKTPVSMTDHFDFVWFLFLAALGILTFLATRTLCKIDRNQSELFKRMIQVEKELSHLYGEHEATCGTMVRKIDQLTNIMRGTN